MTFKNFSDLAKSINKMMDDSEKFMAPVLAARAVKLAEKYPHDITVVSVASVLSKYADKNMLISRKEIQDLYKSFYTNNTKFASYFKDELGEYVKLATPTTYSRPEAELDTKLDTPLANALTSVFDKSETVKEFSNVCANKAVSEVSNKLTSLNVSASKLSVMSGNEKVIVVKADYDTPRGISTVYVPVEMVGSKTMEPSHFVGSGMESPQELTHESVNDYLLNSFESKLASYDAAPVKDLEMPKSDEFISFEKKFASPGGEAGFKFGEGVVRSGLNLVAAAVKDFGYKNPQIKVSGSENDKIFYAVSVNRIGFTVPVKVAKNKAMYPNLIVANGSVKPFTKEVIASFVDMEESDYMAASVASPQYDLKPSELIDSVKTAMANSNLEMAEDALNVLKQSGNMLAYAEAFGAYVKGLSSDKEAKAESSCSLVIKNAKTSKYPICGHTNLPLHKVYQDEFGYCQPLSRKGLTAKYEGTTFMTNKILGQ